MWSQAIPLTIRPAAGGIIVDYFSLYDGPVRIAVVADSKPEPMPSAEDLLFFSSQPDPDEPAKEH